MSEKVVFYCKDKPALGHMICTQPERGNEIAKASRAYIA